METIVKIIEIAFFVVVFVFVFLLFLQQTKIMWDTRNMTDEECRKYYKKYHVFD